MAFPQRVRLPFETDVRMKESSISSTTAGNTTVSVTTTSVNYLQRCMTVCCGSMNDTTVETFARVFRESAEGSILGNIKFDHKQWKTFAVECAVFLIAAVVAYANAGNTIVLAAAGFVALVSASLMLVTACVAAKLSSVNNDAAGKIAEACAEIAAAEQKGRAGVIAFVRSGRHGITFKVGRAGMCGCGSYNRATVSLTAEVLAVRYLQLLKCGNAHQKEVGRAYAEASPEVASTAELVVGDAMP